MKKLFALTLIMPLLFIFGCSSSVNGPDEVEPDYSLGKIRYTWTKCSCPATIEPDLTIRGNLIWYNPYDADATDQIYDSIDDPKARLTTLSLKFQPATYKTIANPTDPCVIDSAIEIDPKTSWVGIMRAFPVDSRNFDSTTYLEIRMRANHGADLQEGQLIIELGDISEDINGDCCLNTEDANRNGILESFEDVGLDGLSSEDEPCYDPISNPDPSGDDWNYDNKYDYSRINGTEGNRYSEGGQDIDTEDLNGWGSLDLWNDYFGFTIDLEKEWLGTGHYVPGSDFNGWRTYRIDLKDEENYTIIGNPDWNGITYARLWLTGFDTAVTLEIADADFDYIVPPDTTTPTSMVIYKRDFDYLARTFFWLGPAEELDTIDEILDARIYVFHQIQGPAGSDTTTWYNAEIAMDPNRADITEDPEYRIRTVKQLPDNHYYLYEQAKYLELFSYERTRLIAGYFRVRSIHGVEYELGSLASDTLVLKLIAQSRDDANPEQVSFYNEWKNVYPLGVRNIDPTSINVQIYKGEMGTEESGINSYKYNGVPYIEILGLDQYGETAGSDPDGRIDADNPNILLADRGYIIIPPIYPNAQPFNPPEGCTYAQDGTELPEKVPELYNTKLQTILSDPSRYSKYYIKTEIYLHP
jgi:hypothetical protein